MKKLLAIVLVVLMFASLAVPVFADDVFTETETGKEYQISIEEGETTTNYTEAIYVKITYTLTNAKINSTITKTWNPDSLTWSDNTTNTVDVPAASFTIENRSTVGIGIMVSWDAAEVFGSNPKVGDHDLGDDAFSVNLNPACGYDDDRTPADSADSTTIDITFPTDNDFKNALKDLDIGAQVGTITINLDTPQ